MTPVTVEVERITPGAARKWLDEFNHDNRPLRESVVERYARDIAAGSWDFTGDAIRFNGRGLIDGQHRLAAVVKAGKPIKSVVIRGLPSAARVNIDTGAARSLRDHLVFLGYPKGPSTHLAALIRWCVAYETAGSDRSPANLRRAAGTRSELLGWLEKNPEAAESARWINNHDVRRMRGLGLALAAVHYYSRDGLPGEAEAFASQLVKGTGLQEGDAVLMLRRFVENQTMRERPASIVVCHAVAIKAWNAYIAGEPVTRLTYRAGGSNPEAFPQITTSHD